MKDYFIEQAYKDGIIFISPQYKEGIGDTTLIQTEKEEVLIERNIKTIIRSLCRYFFLDLEESKSYYRDLLNKGRNIPLVINKDNVFICVKTRIPIGKNDGAMSYVNPKYIQDYDCGLIELEGGHKLETFNSKASIRNNLKDYQLILRDMKVRI